MSTSDPSPIGTPRFGDAGRTGRTRFSTSSGPFATRRCETFAGIALGALLSLGTSGSVTRVQTVVRHLVDVASRGVAGEHIVCELWHDDRHVCVSVEELAGPAPTPADEPALLEVDRLTEDRGQYAGDRGGTVMWASVRIR